MNESHVIDGGFHLNFSQGNNSNISVFRSFVTKEILKLITNQTNIYD
jgi:hypothetical protein